MVEAAIANLNSNRNCGTVRVYRYMHVSYDFKLPSETSLGQERGRLAPLLRPAEGCKELPPSDLANALHQPIARLLLSDHYQAPNSQM